MSRKKGRAKRRQLQIWEGVGATYAPRGLSTMYDGDDWDYQPFDYSAYYDRIRAPYNPHDWDRWLFRPRLKKPDVDFVTPSLATGGFIGSTAEAQALKDAGITHVVNCASELTREGELFADLGIEYLFNPTPDNFQPKPPEWFGKTVDFAVPAILDGGKVYAHCLEGVNRGPSNAYAILLALGHPGDEAFDLIQSARPRAKVFYRPDADLAHKEFVQ